MSKFGLQDLAAAIVKKHGLEQDKAEMMVKVFFETVENGLNEDKYVKVKGLGTFKVIEVEPRESVNVNTGERVIIEGHEKINFSPEAALKDLVNKPFSQFETVVLNDGTDFSGLNNATEKLLENLNDDPFAMTENAEDGNGTDYSKESTGEFATENTVEKSDSMNDSSQEVNEIQEEDVLTIKTETEDQEEPIHILSESPEKTIMPEVAVENNLSKEEPTAEDHISEKQLIDKSITTDKKDSFLEEEQVLEKSVEKDTKEENDLEVESIGDKKSSTINDTILIIVIAIVCYVGGYMTSAFFPLDKLLSVFGGAQVEKPVIQKKFSPHIAKKPAAITKVNPAVKNASGQSKVKENADSAPHKEMSIEKSQHINSNGNFDSEKYDKANRQVRYGAYRIVGVAKTIKLKNGQTLNSIAKRDFGSKEMLCYILALNEMNAVTQVKEGQTILIPKLELRHKKEK